jgi:DNA-binding NarL/FixJ family response regulator
MLIRRQQVRLLIADDHPIFREGLRLLLETEADFKVVGEAADGAQAVKLARQLKPDVLLLDLAMPKHPSLEALRDLSLPLTRVRDSVNSVRREEPNRGGSTVRGKGGCAQGFLNSAVV